MRVGFLAKRTRERSGLKYQFEWGFVFGLLVMFIAMSMNQKHTDWKFAFDFVAGLIFFVIAKRMLYMIVQRYKQFRQ
ncbi:hypothetical protein [Bacillus paramycoides]|uniref:Uncharacterized protein n=1 Tax=Bacillus paramycoides TaxID=2026194 RepID=A0A1J9VP08_9BACI|nr:hypothetical protein [Bacillus paramycoides]MED0960902.1 hypothetical protein [Bacillus paramycoides]MED1410686.1 hypothetical protein [Bacillus paramycoides]MED1463930.1 hypothetical protein [Bacillus paramycoides]MED1492277.1 hypothetical protein [Bacillus paramycoides]NWK69347.1 hypothetical protein [Bacillus paramycoides]